MGTLFFLFFFLQWNSFFFSSSSLSQTSIDVSSLAQITEGYTAGGIKACIQSTVTTRRMERVEKNPLTEAEFLRALSRQPRVYREKNTGTFVCCCCSSMNFVALYYSKYLLYIVNILHIYELFFMKYTLFFLLFYKTYYIHSISTIYE